VRAALIALLLATAAPAVELPPQANEKADEADEADDAEDQGEAKAPPFEPPDPKNISELTKNIFADPRYRFCHSEKFPLSLREMEWCHQPDQRKEMRDRCPALEKACAQLIKDPELRMPHLGSAPRILLFAVLAAVLLWLAVKLGRHFVLQRAGNVAAISGGDSAAPLEPVQPEAHAVESDVERLLALARQAAAQGLHAQAVDHAYAALLRRLEADGLVRVEKWRTNGDYLRDLRTRPELRDQVRAIVREVEALQFGVSPPSASAFESLLGRILPLVQGVLLVLLATLFSACGMGRGNEADSPSGGSAVRELLSRAGVPVEHRVKALDKMEDTSGAVLLFAEPEPGEWELLHDWVKRGGGLLIAAPMPLPSWLGVKRQGMPTQTPPHLRVPEDTRQTLGDPQVWLPRASCLSGGDPALSGSGCDYAVAVKMERGLAIVLGDGQLFENASLAMADNAAFMVAVVDFTRRPGRLQIVDETTGRSSPNPFVSLARAGLGLMLLQLALLVLLWFWHRGKAFGKLHDPPPPPRRAFVEHVRALGAQYAKAKALPHVLQAIDQLSRTGGRK
jgi:hypothetical protein